MDALTFNEAKLRGIDLKKLQQEAFTTMQHTTMVKDHEARKKITAEWELFKKSAEYVALSKSSAKPSTTTRVVSKKKPMSFTDVQLKIAIEALGKK